MHCTMQRQPGLPVAPHHACPPRRRRSPCPAAPCRQIAADYADRRPLIIGTLKGAVVFLSDLVRAVEPLPPGLEVSKGKG